MNGRASYREGAAFAALGLVLAAVLGIVSSIAVARLYGITVLGQFALVISPVGIAWSLSTVSEQAALVRKISLLPPRDPRVTGMFGAVFTFSFVLTLVVAALVMVVTVIALNGPIDHPDLVEPALVSMVGYLFITNTGWNLDAVLAAFRAGRALFWIRLAQAVSYFLLAVVGALVSPTVWMLVMATIGSYFVCLIGRCIAIRAFMRYSVSRAALRDGFSVLPELIRFGLKIVPGTIADGLANQAGVWILGASGTLPSLGAYNRAWQLGYRFVESKDRITDMLFPTLVERDYLGDHKGFDRALVDSLRYTAVGLLLPAAAGAGAAYGIMNLFGPGFSTAAVALALLLLMPALATMSSIQRHALFAVDRPLMGSAAAFARAVATIGATVPLTLWLGVTGAALAVVLGFAVDLGIMIHTSRRHMVSGFLTLWPLRELSVLAFAYVVGVVAARAGDILLPGMLGTFVAIALGAVAYASAFVLAGGVNGRDRERVRVVWRKLRLRSSIASRIAGWPARLRSTT